VCVLLCAVALAQEPAAKPAGAAQPSERAAEAKGEEKSALPFQIQLLETHVRFESNGDSRKEVHTIVKIDDLAGARQFSRLEFDYNRAFQRVDIPLIKISHANGGTSEILPSAITDAPNPAVQDFPAYHDVRVKSVRILGLQDGDTIEYRVITMTTKHPVAPNFWVEHTFDHSGQVVEERYEIDLPAKLAVQLRINQGVPPQSIEATNSDSARVVHKWILFSSNLESGFREQESREPDIVLTTFKNWHDMQHHLGAVLSYVVTDPELAAQVQKVTQMARTTDGAIRLLYEFVSTQIQTVDLPLGQTDYRLREPDEVLSSKYATAEEKCSLLSFLIEDLNNGPSAECRLALAADSPEGELPRPTLFTKALVVIHASSREQNIWLDPSLEVAPFGMIPSQIRGHRTLGLSMEDHVSFDAVPLSLPFASFQNVAITADLLESGSLKAKVKYTMRGDNELLLRVAFHQTPKERWKEVAGLMALSDGFRGSITNVTASDPMATKDPFTVEYEITQAKFVDWSKKPVRIPALLPQIALPDLPGKSAGKIELGTPLDVQTSLKLQLPEGTTVQTPAATSVARDYATFASKYDGHLNTVSVSRHINFLKREIPSERATDYNAFLRAVQNDQAQMLVLLPPSAAAATTP
jgi:hypothetical protein